MEVIYKVVDNEVIILSASWDNDDECRWTQIVYDTDNVQDIEMYKVLNAFNRWAVIEYKEELEHPLTDKQKLEKIFKNCFGL